MFHYLIKHIGKGVRGSLKTVYVVDQDQKIVKTLIVKESIEEEKIKHNKNYFTKPHKTKVYQDSHKSFDILTPLEKLNCKCDEKVKSLIIEARTRIFPFPFTLPSPYLRSSKKKFTS